jgi:hypothetical protein
MTSEHFEVIVVGSELCGIDARLIICRPRQSLSSSAKPAMRLAARGTCLATRASVVIDKLRH